MGPAGRPPWARVEQGCPDSRADIHREHRARLKGPPAGRRGAAAGGREEGPASSGWHPEVPGLRAVQRGAVPPGEGEEQRWGARERVPAGAFCCPSLVAQAQLAPRPLRSTGTAPGSWLHLATTTEAKGEELLREGCWGGGGEEAGQGGPPGALHPDRHYSYGRAVSDPQRLGCPVPAASPCQSSLAEPSSEPVVMEHVD